MVMDGIVKVADFRLFSPVATSPRHEGGGLYGDLSWGTGLSDSGKTSGYCAPFRRASLSAPFRQPFGLQSLRRLSGSFRLFPDGTLWTLFRYPFGLQPLRRLSGSFRFFPGSFRALPGRHSMDTLPASFRIAASPVLLCPPPLENYFRASSCSRSAAILASASACLARSLATTFSGADCTKRSFESFFITEARKPS